MGNAKKLDKKSIPEPRGIMIRIMTKEKGLHQRFFPDLTINDIEWFDAFEFVQGRPTEPKHVISIVKGEQLSKS